MPTAGVQYRFRIYSTDDSTVETTFQAQLQGWEAVGGQEIRPLDGRAETRPWSVRVVDASTAVTNDLADSSGRLRRMGRLADFQQNLDSSGWATLATGRISDVFLGENVATYQFVLEDEWQRVREAMIFNSTAHDPTCYLYPPGLRSAWMGLTPRQVGNAKVFSRTGNLTAIVFDSTAPVSAVAMRELEDDLRSVPNNWYSNTTAGNFKFLRFHGNGADFEVYSFGSRSGPDFIAPTRVPPEEQIPMAAVVVDPTTALGNAIYPAGVSASTVGIVTSAYLYSPGKPPTEGEPWHLPSAHPDQHLKDIYDSSYGGTAIRYDTTAITNLIANKSIPSAGFRITNARQMGEFTETAIYGSFGQAGFINRDGRIMPRSLFLPSTVEVDQSSLMEFTGSNLREPHPSWEHTRRELVTVVAIPFIAVRQLTDREVAQRGFDVAADFVDMRNVRPGYNLSSAAISGTASPQFYEHDRLSIGRITHTVPLEALTDGAAWHAPLAQQIFDRYGDGPVFGTFQALSSGTSGVLPGDFVKLTLGTYPNMAIQGRGNTRIVQILSVMDTPYGPEFDYLDAGPNSTVLASPTVTVSTSVNSPKHVIQATVSNVTTDGGFHLQVANGSTIPSSDSTKWESVIGVGINETSDTFDVDRRMSGTTWWARARNTKIGRWRSAWGYSTKGAETQALTAPSGVLSSSVTSITANISWTNSTASTGYDLDLGYQFTPNATGVLIGQRVTDRLPAGTNRAVLTDISGSTAGGAYAALVRYADPFGGVSTFAASSNFTLGALPPTGDNWSTGSTAIELVYGVNTTAEVY